MSKKKLDTKQQAIKDGFRDVKPLEIGQDGKPEFPEGVDQFTVTKEGEYFCNLAAQKGFRDCTYLREINTHLTDKAVLDPGDVVAIPKKRPKSKTGKDRTRIESVRVDYPPATIRILGINENVGDRTITSLPRIGISNYVTNKAQVTPDKDGNVGGKEREFYKQQGADDTGKMGAKEKETHADPDHFRVEIHDVSAKKGVFYKKGTVKVEMQVLQPVYKRDDKDWETALRKQLALLRTPLMDDDESDQCIFRDMDFVDTSVAVGERPPKGFKIPKDGNDPKTVRMLVIGCKQGKGSGVFSKTKTTNYFRSPYMRLVTEKEDFIADQTLYVGDYYSDTTLTDDERRYTEILEQEILVRYKPLMCKSRKCRAIQRAKIGELKKEVRLAVHIFDNAADYEDIRRCIYGQVRRTYAQVGIRPHLKLIRKLPPPANLIRLGNIDSGWCMNARGTDENRGPSRVRVKMQGKNPFLFVLLAGRTAAQVATEIVRQLEGAGLYAKSVEHVPLAEPVGVCTHAVDVLVYTDDKRTVPATVESASTRDQDMSIQNSALTVNDLNNMTAENKSVKQRILKCSCQTDWFDVALIHHFLGYTVEEGEACGGVATRVNRPQDFAPFAVVVAAGIKETPHDKRNTIAHELGHVLMHCGHVQYKPNNDQLMIGGGHTDGIDTGDMAGRRRIMGEPLKMRVCVVKPDGAYGYPDISKDHPGGTLEERCHTFVTGEPFGDESPREPSTEW